MAFDDKHDLKFKINPQLLFCVMASLFLNGCGLISEFAQPTSSLIFSISASEPVFDNGYLKSTLTVTVQGEGGPVADYLPQVDWSTETVNPASFYSKIQRLLSVDALNVQVECSRTDQRGIAECQLRVLPPNTEPKKIVFAVNGQEIHLAAQFVVFPEPSITSTSMNQVSFDSGEVLTFSGQSFRIGMTVTIDGNLCQNLIVNSLNALTCTSPLHPLGGPFDIVVTMPDAQEFHLPGAISFVDKTAPTAQWNLVPPARSNVEFFDFEFTGSDNATASNNLTYECQLNSDAWASCASPATIGPFVEGQMNTVRLRVTDEAGLSTQREHLWTYDQTAPTLEMQGFTNFVPNPSSSLGARGLTVSGDDIVNYKYVVITSGTCGAVDFSGVSAQPMSSPTISFTPTIDGTYVVCGIGQDDAGNWQQDSDATASTGLVIDTVVTAFSSLELIPTSPNSESSPGVSGRTESSASMQLYAQASCGGSSVGSTTANAAGEFVFYTSSPLSVDGVYNFSVRATDLAGNSICSTNLPYEFDTTAPTLTFTTPINARGKDSIVISGTCEGSLEVIASGTGVLGEQSTTCSSGTYSFAVLFSAGEGVKNFSLRSRDLAGNLRTISRNFYRDNTEPALALTSPVSGYRTTGSLTLAGTCGTDSADVATVQLSGTGLQGGDQSIACSSGNYTTTVNLTVGDGSKNIMVEQSDEAGNTATLSRNFIRDTTAPTLTITDPDEGFRAPNGVALSGACGSATGDSANVSVTGAGVDGGPIIVACAAGEYTANISFTAGDGTKAFAVTQDDDLGNSVTVHRNFEKDSTAPTLTIVSPVTGARFQGSLTLSGECGQSVDDLPTLTVGGTGVDTPPTTSCVAGSYSIVVNMTAGEGNKIVSISQDNTIGNTTTVMRTFVRDETAPVLVFGSPVVNSYAMTTLTISGSCGNGSGDSSNLVLAGAGLDSPSATTCDSGSFSEEITLTAGEGTKNITVSQVDSAGNGSTVNRNFIRDNTAPTIIITSPAQDTPTQSGATIVGTCTDGAGDVANIVISGAGVSSVTNTTCTAQAFSHAITFSAGGGSKEINVTQSDLAGNTHTANVRLIRDNTAPVVNLTSLTGGQIIRGGQSTAITWTANDSVELAINPVTIHYSLNGGTTWTVIASNIANTGSYAWNMPGFNSSTARVRVTVLDKAGNSTSATSSSNFTIDSSLPILTLNSLTGGQVLKGGSVVDIMWSVNLSLQVIV